MNSYPSPHQIQKIIKAEQKSNKEIEKFLEAEREKLKREITLLLLGPGEAGKSTIAKQLKLIHDRTWSDAERLEYKELIIHNIVKSIGEVLEAMEQFGYQPEEDNLNIVKYLSEIETLNEKTASLFSKLLKDKAIEQTLNRSSEFLLKESAPYFFSEIERIADPNYIPTDSDILRSRKKTTAIIETFFEVDKITFKVIDVGGQRSQRKKWMHLFQDVNAVIFCASLSCYNLQLRESRDINAFDDCLDLFKEIVNTKWFINTPVILFLNKSDLFKEKIATAPLTNYFTDYKGSPNDYDESLNFIKRKFLSQSQNPDKMILTHVTCATDSSCIVVVFKAVRTFILNQILHGI